MSTSGPVLTMENVSKRYRRGVPAYGSLRDLLAGARVHGEEVVALDGVHLHVDPGEVLGILGPNGAGKSTLLKVVARITPPETGRIEVRGRCSALIEVGAGFHPELTGRENVLLHGSILGLPRRMLAEAMDEIADFAGVRDAMDTPVKFFSTGMYARLGFAVAVHAEPRLLLVDEVLSVGDLAFRERCHDRIRLLTRDGTGVLFVSHDLPALEALTHRALHLDAGRIVREGAPADVVRGYREVARP